jgi:uncharacterized protein YjbJ (UPF0337 family)
MIMVRRALSLCRPGPKFFGRRSIITAPVGLCLRTLHCTSYRWGECTCRQCFSRRRNGPPNQPLKEIRMNKDTIEGNWKQLKGKVKEQWGKLTDDDFDVIAGKRDQLLGRIQERHGISRDEAEKQVKDWESRDGRTPDALWFERY